MMSADSLINLYKIVETYTLVYCCSLKKNMLDSVMAGNPILWTITLDHKLFAFTCFQLHAQQMAI